jgi:hypothetical protein
MKQVILFFDGEATYANEVKREYEDLDVIHKAFQAYSVHDKNGKTILAGDVCDLPLQTIPGLIHMARVLDLPKKFDHIKLYEFPHIIFKQNTSD